MANHGILLESIPPRSRCWRYLAGGQSRLRAISYCRIFAEWHACAKSDLNGGKRVKSTILNTSVAAPGLSFAPEGFVVIKGSVTSNKLLEDVFGALTAVDCVRNGLTLRFARPEKHYWIRRSLDI